MHPVFNVGAFFRFLTCPLAFATGKNRGEDVAKTAAKPAGLPSGFPARFIHVGKIKTGKVHAGWGCVRGSGRTRAGTVTARGEVVRIESVLIVDLALLLVTQDFVSFRELLEFFFRPFVPRIDVGMKLAGQMAVSLAKLLRLGITSDAKGGIIVFLWSTGHDENLSI